MVDRVCQSLRAVVELKSDDDDVGAVIRRPDDALRCGLFRAAASFKHANGHDPRIAVKSRNAACVPHHGRKDARDVCSVRPCVQRAVRIAAGGRRDKTFHQSISEFRMRIDAGVDDGDDDGTESGVNIPRAQRVDVRAGHSGMTVDDLTGVA